MLPIPKMASSKAKSLSNLLGFAIKYRQNSASATANHAGISYRSAEIPRCLHTYSNDEPEEPKIEIETWNQDIETLRRLGVIVSVESCKSVAKDNIEESIFPNPNRRLSFRIIPRIDENSVLSSEGREKLMSVFEFMKKQGLSIEEEMYSSDLCELINEHSKEEFQFLIRKIKEAFPDSSSGLGYYEMLSWIKIDNEEKIEEICRRIIDRWDRLSSLEVNYLEAFCVTCQYEYLQRLLKTVDITKATSLDQLTPIFEYLGRLDLMIDAKRLLGELKGTAWAEHISHLIFSYATSSVHENEDIPGKANAFEMCRVLHTEVGFKPSFEFFEKLIAFECDSQDDHHYSQHDHRKIPLAAKIVDEMRENGLIEDSEDGRYFHDTIERIYGIDWLRTTEAVINDMGSKKFQLNKFISKFSDYKVESRWSI